MKACKTSICLFAVMSMFFSILYPVFQSQNYFSPQTIRNVKFAAAKTTVTSVTTKQKNIKLFEIILSMQMCVAICISVMNASVNEMERIYLDRNLHPSSNRAPPV